MDGMIVGFYVLAEKGKHLLLDHFYIKTEPQGDSIGTSVIGKIKKVAKSRGLPLVLGALRGSKSNNFYMRNGSIKTHESEFDIHYRYIP